MKNKVLDITQITNDVLSGDIVALSKAITIIESNKEEHNEIANKILNILTPHSGNSLRIGITGPPGVGKSTFIENFGLLLCNKGYKVAVLAIDPTSQITKGSILGDKTRMENLSINKNSFIRPSAAGNYLGGIAAKTREAIILCEAAGYNRILIETVGVGQSETAVKSITDFFLLLLLPSSGDDLQGIKKGVVELADTILINKADGDLISQAKITRDEYKSALRIINNSTDKWKPRVEIISSLENNGLDDLLQIINDFEITMKKNGNFYLNRNKQTKEWLERILFDKIKYVLYQNKYIKNYLLESEEKVISGEISISEVVNTTISLLGIK